ncbi:MAG: aromatic amino acid ammonia-lyase, partial [Bacteroidales bacterium]|nr:aromatic amino acid ammonia-lyase [Bacteroidales bacterium]
MEKESPYKLKSNRSQRPVKFITHEQLDFEDIEIILDEKNQLQLSPETIARIQHCRNYLDQKMETSSDPIYGVNTGFGALCDVKISKSDLSTLQRNLVMSHSCGTGNEVSKDIVRLMLLLKVQSLSYGHSAAQVETVQRLLDFFNHDVLPIVYEFGSLGASGDLAPLAHLSLPLLGLGEVWHEGKKQNASVVLKKFGWQPINLKSKEGLALLNGTQFMSAIGVSACLQAFRLSRLADIIASISLDAFDGRIEPFHELIQLIRPHKGQIKTASRIRALLEGSDLTNRYKRHIQDP